MLRSLLLFAAAFAAVPAAQASSLEQRGRTCQNNACLSAVVGKHNKPCKAKCESYLRITVTPATLTRTSTVTAYVTTDKPVPATARTTTLVTITQTQSLVETDLESVTATSTNFNTATVTTTDATTTVTTGVIDDTPPFKRDLNANGQEKRGAPVNAPAGPITNRPTKIPRTASACNNSAFSSACSCIGVTARTTTLPCRTVTKTTTKTITRARPVTSTVTTTTITSTAKTNTVSTTYSTTTATTTASTTQVDVTNETKTVTKTATVEVPPNPIQTIVITIQGSDDPLFAPSNGQGFLKLLLQERTATQYRTTFSPTPPSNPLLLGLNINTGHLSTLTGPSTGSLFVYGYDALTPSNYVEVMPATLAADRGDSAVVCKISEGIMGDEFLECKWGDNQIAEFWTCGSYWVIVRPGRDISRGCGAGPAAYRIPRLAVSRV